VFVTAASCWAQNDDALAVAAKQVADKFVQSADAKRGEVAEVDTATTPATLYVSLGLKDGILEGQLLEIAAKGEPIVVDGQTIGFRETPIAVAEVSRVQNDRLCLAAICTASPGAIIAKGSLAYLKPVPGTLAVVPLLSPDNAPTSVGQDFAECLATVLRGVGRFQVTDCARVQTVLGELGLGVPDLVDPTKASRLGRELQVKGVVTGTATRLNGQCRLDIRVTDVATERQLLAVTAMTPPPPAPGLFSSELTWMNAEDAVELEENVSMAGVWWPQAICLKGWVTIATQGRLGRVVLEVGAKDGSGHAEKLEIQADGEVIRTIRLTDGMRPAKIELNLTNVQSLKLQNVDGDPTWIRQPGVKMETPRE